IYAHGFYRDVVVARDNTILTGHGLVEAARRMGYVEVPVRRLDVDPDSADAMKIVVGDNELFRFAENDDRKLTEILKEDANGGVAAALLGTGFDPQQLSALVMVTRPRSEVLDKKAAAQYVGMPACVDEDDPPKLVISFDNEADREKLLELIDVKTINRKS